MTALNENNFRPESHYKDTGCKDAGVPSCLDCPLPTCVEEMSSAELAAFRREKRDAVKVRAIGEEGLSVAEASARFGITPGLCCASGIPNLDDGGQGA